jgi:arylsulfatase A-like enzyme
LQQKPVVQQNFVASTNSSEPFSGDFAQKEYIQFYAYLQTLSDQLFAQLLSNMSEDLLNNTIIIRLADHGEMAMAHGGMRFKDLNAYQETINVPLVFSNPQLFPQKKEVDQLVGLVDLLPTLATIVGLTDEEKQSFAFKGIDFSSVLLDTTAQTQTCMLYTYDDDIALNEPGHIRTLVRDDYKFSVYFTMDAVLHSGKPATANVIPSSFTYELYDMKQDPDEMTNLLPVGGTPTPAALKLQAELYGKLTDKMNETGTTPNAWPATVPA